MQPAEQNSGSDATLLLVSRARTVTTSIMREAREEWSLSFRANEEVCVLSKVIAKKIVQHLINGKISAMHLAVRWTECPYRSNFHIA